MSMDANMMHDIQSLQTTEKEMFDNLETNTALTPEQKTQIIDKINAISDMRIQLYKSMNQYRKGIQNNTNTLNHTLSDQIIAIDATENALNQAKKRIKNITNQKINQMRMIQINEYYGEKYVEHNKIIKLFIVLFVYLILIAFLLKRGFIGYRIFMVLLFLMTIPIAYYFWTILLPMYRRNNMNYQEFDWNFDPSSVMDSSGSSTSSSSNDPWMKMTLPATCIGSNCCASGLVYDSSMDLCVVGSSQMANTTNSQLKYADYSGSTMIPIGTNNKFMNYSSGLIFKTFTKLFKESFDGDNKNSIGIFQKSPDNTGITHIIQSNWNDFGVNDITQFSISFQGYFYSKTAGVYTFYFYDPLHKNRLTDDLCYFFIGNNALYPSMHNINKKVFYYESGLPTYSIPLPANAYTPILMYYGQGGGPKSVSLGFSTPTNKTIMFNGDGYFFHNGQ
jgi:hypothetical protein